MRDWIRTIGLLLPLKLRKQPRLRRLLPALLQHTIAAAQAAESLKERLKEESRHIGQREALESLLRGQLGDGRIYIGDGEAPRVAVIGETGTGRETRASAGPDHLLTLPGEGTFSEGSDFVVHVAAGTDSATVRTIVKRYIFAGLTFAVRQDL